MGNCIQDLKKIKVSKLSTKPRDSQHVRAMCAQIGLNCSYQPHLECLCTHTLPVGSFKCRIEPCLLAWTILWVHLSPAPFLAFFPDGPWIHFVGSLSPGSMLYTYIWSPLFSNSTPPTEQHCPCCSLKQNQRFPVPSRYYVFAKYNHTQFFTGALFESLLRTARFIQVQISFLTQSLFLSFPSFSSSVLWLSQPDISSSRQSCSLLRLIAQSHKITKLLRWEGNTKDV